MNKGHREKILRTSVELFNQHGTVAVTTNRVADFLGISPGNFYFHFKSKEDVIRELFAEMTSLVESTWDPKRKLSPKEFVESSLEVFWRFRFFHREMYHLRRRDAELARSWKTHMNRCLRILKQNYVQWIRAGEFRKVDDPEELRMLSESVLLFSGNYLSFFESPEKPASRKSFRAGVDQLLRLLWPYLSDSYKRRLSN